MELFQTVTVVSGKTTPVAVELAPAGGIVSGVVTKNGQPVSGADVVVYSGDFTATTRTDSGGFYRVDDVPPGSATVSVRSGLATRMAQVTVQIAAEASHDFDISGGAVTGVVIGVSASDRVLVGLIPDQAAGVDASDTEEPGTLRGLFKREAWANEDGTFTFNDVEPGSYTISVNPLPETEESVERSVDGIDTRTAYVQVVADSSTRAEISI